MKLKDYEKLRKLMQQATSDNDHEALQALRMANAILKRYELDWDRVFNRVVTVVDEFEAAPDEGRSAHDAERDQVNAAFDVLDGTELRGSFADFIADLRKTWDSTKHLSIGQKDALFRAARRAQGDNRR